MKKILKLHILIVIAVGVFGLGLFLMLHCMNLNKITTGADCKSIFTIDAVYGSNYNNSCVGANMTMKTQIGDKDSQISGGNSVSSGSKLPQEDSITLTAFADKTRHAMLSNVSNPFSDRGSSILLNSSSICLFQVIDSHGNNKTDSYDRNDVAGLTSGVNFGWTGAEAKSWVHFHTRIYYTIGYTLDLGGGTWKGLDTYRTDDSNIIGTNKSGTYAIRYSTLNSSFTLQDGVQISDIAKNCSRTGCKMLGIYGSSTNRQYVDAEGNVTITQNTACVERLEVRWQQLYKLTLDVNGGYITPSNGFIKDGSNVYKWLEEGSAYGAFPTVTRSGHDFLGWFTTKDGGDTVDANKRIGTADVTVYAHWNAKQYTVTFNKKGGEGGTGDTRVIYGTKPTTKIDVPHKDGFIFSGYYSDEDCNYRYINENGDWISSYFFSSNREFYAGWTGQDQTLTLDLNGGSFSQAPKGWTESGGLFTKTLKTNGLTEMPTENPTRQGYTFAGWAKQDPGMSGEFGEFMQEGESWPVSDEYTPYIYYPFWEDCYFEKFIKDAFGDDEILTNPELRAGEYNWFYQWFSELLEMPGRMDPTYTRPLMGYGMLLQKNYVDDYESEYKSIEMQFNQYNYYYYYYADNGSTYEHPTEMKLKKFLSDEIPEKWEELQSKGGSMALLPGLRIYNEYFSFNGSPYPQEAFDEDGVSIGFTYSGDIGDLMIILYPNDPAKIKYMTSAMAAGEGKLTVSGDENNRTYKLTVPLDFVIIPKYYGNMADYTLTITDMAVKGLFDTFSYMVDGFKMGTTSTTLQAQWDPIPYFVELKSNEGKFISGKIPSDWQFDETTLKMNAFYGTPFNLPTMVTYDDTNSVSYAIERSGYIFKGWGKSADATTVPEELRDGAKLENLTDQTITITYYALWEETIFQITPEAPVGEGTSNSPYIVADIKNLVYIAQKVEEGETFFEKIFKQTQNIDVSGKYWMPIGDTSKNIFSGTYDGNGFVIQGLHTLNQTSASGKQIYSNVGLFGRVGNAVLKNIILVGAKDVNSIYGNENVGAIVGCADYTTTFINCSNFIASVGNSNIGMIGKLGNNCTVLACYNYGNVKGDDCAGGLIGKVEKGCIIKNSYASCEVKGDANSGGFVGSLTNATLSNSCFDGKVGPGNGLFVGSSTSSTISDCFARDKDSTLGFVGSGEASNCIFENKTDNYYLGSSFKNWVYDPSSGKFLPKGLAWLASGYQNVDTALLGKLGYKQFT